MVTRFKTSKVHVNPFANVVDSSQPYLATLERELEFMRKQKNTKALPIGLAIMHMLQPCPVAQTPVRDSNALPVLGSHSNTEKVPSLTPVLSLAVEKFSVHLLPTASE